VGAPFGLKGFVKVKSFSGETGHFFRLKNVILRSGDRDEICEVAEIQIKGDSLLIRFSGIENPETAETLKGAEIIVEREFAAPLEEGEFYIEDLKGLEVVSESQEKFGHINSVMEGGGGLLAELALSSGEKRLVPFRKEFFGEVLLDQGKIVLLAPWLLD